MTHILDDDHIVTPSGRYHLREAVDPYCHEWNTSILTDDQRRAIFDVIGPKALTKALERLYAADKHLEGDDAAQTIKLAYWRLYGQPQNGEVIGD